MCRQYLSTHDWNVENAIETALISNSDSPTDTNHISEQTNHISQPQIPPNTSVTARYMPNSAL